MTDIDLNPLARSSVVYATDENVAVRCPGDFDELIPDYQMVAKGSDGMIVVAMGPFQVMSNTVNFTTAGCQPGQIVHLNDSVGTFGPDGDYFAVDMAASNYIVVRRMGQAPGMGQPPTQADITGIKFTIKTAGPQLEAASYEISRQLKIDPNSPFWNPDNLYDRRELRLACVNYALVDLYSSQTRTKDSDWSNKIARFTGDRDRAMSRLSVRWGINGNAALPTQSNRGRVSR